MSLLRKIKNKIRHKTMSARTELKPVDKWFADKGDETLRLYYENLNAESVVFDLGGYKGQWASDIFAKYCCQIHVFEPVPTFYEKITQRFQHNKSIKVHPFGLAAQTQSMAIDLCEDGSSMFKDNSETSIEGSLMSVTEFWEKEGVEKINLMKINIEGGEYELLEVLIQNKIINSIDNIQVQFHDFIPNAYARMRLIQEALSVTHELTYQYEFVWENWRKKSEFP